MLEETTINTSDLGKILKISNLDPEILIPMLDTSFHKWINNADLYHVEHNYFPIDDKIILSHEVPELMGARKNTHYAVCLLGNIAIIRAQKTNIGAEGDDLLMVRSVSIRSNKPDTYRLLKDSLLDQITAEDIDDLKKEAAQLITVPTIFGKDFYDFYGLPEPKRE